MHVVPMCWIHGVLLPLLRGLHQHLEGKISDHPHEVGVRVDVPVVLLSSQIIGQVDDQTKALQGGLINGVETIVNKIAAQKHAQGEYFSVDVHFSVA